MLQFAVANADPLWHFLPCQMAPSVFCTLSRGGTNIRKFRHCLGVQVLLFLILSRVYLLKIVCTELKLGKICIESFVIFWCILPVYSTWVLYAVCTLVSHNKAGLFKIVWTELQLEGKQLKWWFCHISPSPTSEALMSWLFLVNSDQFNLPLSFTC